MTWDEKHTQIAENQWIWQCKCYTSECMSHPFLLIIKDYLFNKVFLLIPPSCDIVILGCFCHSWHLRLQNRETDKTWPAKNKRAIVFSYNDRQAHLQLFTSWFSVLANMVLVGVVVISTGTLCHACVLCSSISVGRQSLQALVQIIFPSQRAESTTFIDLCTAGAKTPRCHRHPDPLQLTPHDSV